MIAIIKAKTSKPKTSFGNDAEKPEPLCTVDGNVHATAAIEKSMKGSSEK